MKYPLTFIPFFFGDGRQLKFLNPPQFGKNLQRYVQLALAAIDQQQVREIILAGRQAAHQNFPDHSVIIGGITRPYPVMPVTIPVRFPVTETDQ